MWFLYLDESGDLGFDFFGKRPSRFFTVTILALRETSNNRALINAIKKTIRRKLPRRRSVEFKGSHTSIEVKRYFYGLVRSIPFGIYALTLNKRRVYEELTRKKDRVYNFIARNVLDQLPLEKASTRVLLVIDRSKSRREIGDFNAYLVRQLQGRLDPKVPLDIYHHASQENPGLQAADLFSWGIFRKYERKDLEWFNVFREKVRYDDRYL
ncbi:MAG: DUF3800 domain-containing protein [Deltaproteobacteria bacterium]|nr:DUF3800 domain-containing protein [Deltaproteobacteria bacterium]